MLEYYYAMKNLFSTVLFLLLSAFTYGAGWSFTVDIRVTGSECGSYSHNIPYPNMAIATKAQCEFIRNYISSIKYYDIGCTGYVVCGPCTGSDILTTSSTGSYGDVSIDGMLVGKPYFSENNSTVIGNWINEYKYRMQALGLSPDIDIKNGIMNLPATGDEKFDKLYSDQIVAFEKGGNTPVDLSGKSQALGSTPMLLTSDEEIRKQDEWIKKNGLSSNMQQMGDDNVIPSDVIGNIKTQADRDYENYKQMYDNFLFAIGNMPGGALPAEIGGFVNKLSENTFENLDNGVKAIVGTGSPDAFIDEKDVVVKTVSDIAVDKMKDFAKGSVVSRGSVGDALETGGVITYVQNSASWIYKSIKGK